MTPSTNDPNSLTLIAAIQGKALSVLFAMAVLGEPVSPERLVAILGGTRNTILDALRRLEAHGLVRRNAYRGDCWELSALTQGAQRWQERCCPR